MVRQRTRESNPLPQEVTGDSVCPQVDMWVPCVVPRLAEYNVVVDVQAGNSSLAALHKRGLSAALLVVGSLM